MNSVSIPDILLRRLQPASSFRIRAERRSPMGTTDLSRHHARIELHAWPRHYARKVRRNRELMDPAVPTSERDRVKRTPMLF